MKRFDQSRRDDGDEERDGPPGERSSGVRACGVPRPPGDRLGTPYDEAYRRYFQVVWKRIHEKVGNDVGAVEDVHQQVFFRLYRRIGPNGPVPEPLFPVLLGLIADELANGARFRRRHPEGDAPDSKVPTSKPDPEELCSRAEQQAEEQRQVADILDRMSGDQRALLELARDDASLKDAAAEAGIRDDTLRARLARAKAAFRKLYESIYGSRREP